MPGTGRRSRRAFCTHQTPGYPLARNTQFRRCDQPASKLKCYKSAKIRVMNHSFFGPGKKESAWAKNSDSWLLFFSTRITCKLRCRWRLITSMKLRVACKGVSWGLVHIHNPGNEQSKLWNGDIIWGLLPASSIQPSGKILSKMELREVRIKKGKSNRASLIIANITPEGCKWFHFPPYERPLLLSVPFLPVVKPCR